MRLRENLHQKGIAGGTFTGIATLVIITLTGTGLGAVNNIEVIVYDNGYLLIYGNTSWSFKDIKSLFGFIRNNLKEPSELEDIEKLKSEVDRLTINCKSLVSDHHKNLKYIAELEKENTALKEQAMAIDTAIKALAAYENEKGEK